MSNINEIYEFHNIGFWGAGCYGTALAQCFSSVVDSIIMVSDTKSVVEDINQNHCNAKYIPDVILSSNIIATLDSEMISNVDCLFITVPASAVLKVCSQLNNVTCPIILCSKGFDPQSGELLSTVVCQKITNEIVILSGPSFASEICKGLSAGVNIAGKNMNLVKRIAECLSSEKFKLVPIDDFISLQIAGVCKNILAVGCGILLGMDCGKSAVAKFITEGIHEMISFAKKCDGKSCTFLELGGIGDIILTCTNDMSRNVTFGKFCAQNHDPQSWQGPLAEGSFAAKFIPSIIEKFNVSMPNFYKIYEIIYAHKSPKILLEQ